MPDLIKRTSLIVRDAEVSARWYEFVLGMHRAMDTPFVLSGEQLAAGRKGDRLRLVIMAGADEQTGAIGLMQWLDPVMDLPAERASQVRFGMPVFVVASQDCAATVKRARLMGSRVHCEPREWAVTGFGGVEQTMLGASVFDPDGYFFEINQRLA